MSERQKITIATRKDFDVSYYCGSGPGGQARNKSATGVQIIHRETGAIGRAHDSRSQEQNRKHAFERLLKTPQMKFWLAKKKYEVQQQESMEETVARETRDENCRFEIQDEKGRWLEVPASYFETAAAKGE